MDLNAGNFYNPKAEKYPSRPTNLGWV
jgi:hypothetical protein